MPTIPNNHYHKHAQQAKPGHATQGGQPATQRKLREACPPRNRHHVLSPPARRRPGRHASLCDALQGPRQPRQPLPRPRRDGTAPTRQAKQPDPAPRMRGRRHDVADLGTQTKTHGPSTPTSNRNPRSVSSIPAIFHCARARLGACRCPAEGVPHWHAVQRSCVFCAWLSPWLVIPKSSKAV